MFETMEAVDSELRTARVSNRREVVMSSLKALIRGHTLWMTHGKYMKFNSGSYLQLTGQMNTICWLPIRCAYP